MHRRRVRRANPASVDSIFEATASQYAVSADEYVGFRSGAAVRYMAAYLCRRYSTATLRELSDRFGLRHPNSVSDLIRRGAKRIEQSTEAIRQQTAIEKKLGPNPESDPSEATLTRANEQST